MAHAELQDVNLDLNGAHWAEIAPESTPTTHIDG